MCHGEKQTECRMVECKFQSGRRIVSQRRGCNNVPSSLFADVA